MSAHALLRIARLLPAMLALCAVPPLCAAGSIAQQTRDLPEIAAPAGGAAAWIARAMRLNGVPMTIKSFTSPTNADEVLHQYERKLRVSSGMKTRRTQDGAWGVLAVIADDYYATIRARDAARGAEGTITVTPPLAKARPAMRSSFPRPDTAEIVNLQEYDDEGIEAEHINLVSRRSVAIEARAFAARLSQQGWDVLRNEPTQRHDAHAIEAQKAAALAFITLRRAERDRATTILVVWRKQ